MKLPEHEREAHRQAFRAMSLPQKLEYVLAYYKLPIVLVTIALVAVGSVLHGVLTHKDAALYVAYVNMEADEALDETLTEGFVRSEELSTRTNEVVTYPDLYLSDAETTSDHQYSYASRLKLLAAIDAEQLDVVLMSRSSYDLLSHSGYLMDLGSITSLPQSVATLVADNDVIVEDNYLEVQLNEADTYEAETVRVTNALNLSGMPVFSNFTGDVYVGIIANTPRLDASLRYLDYLCKRAG